MIDEVRTNSRRTAGALLRVVVAALVAVVTGTLLWTPSASAATSEEPVTGACHATPGRRIVVATVPTVVGFTFEINGRSYRTNADGSVQIPSVTCGDPERALRVASGGIDQGGGTTATFDSWFGYQLLGRTRGDGTVYAAFRQRTKVDLRLVDLQRAPIARSHVGAIVIKGSTGAQIQVPRGQSSVVLDSSRVVRFSTGLVSKDILWSVQSADIDGNTAVTRGAVRFEPRKTKVVTVPLMLYPLHLTVRDTILHRPVGNAVSVIAPDGSVRTVRLGSDATGELPALARGHYILRAQGHSIAISFKQPVAMSRPQNAVLTVVSYVDVGIGAAVVLTVVIGLFLVGRRLRHRASATSEPATSEPATSEQSGHEPAHVGPAQETAGSAAGGTHRRTASPPEERTEATRP